MRASPSRAEFDSGLSCLDGASSSEGPDPQCPTLDALTSTAQIPISYSGSAKGAASVRSHPSAFARGPKGPVTRMRVQIRESGRSARKRSEEKGHVPRSGTRGALLRTPQRARGGTSPEFWDRAPERSRWALLRTTRSARDGHFSGILGADGLGLADCFRCPPDAGTTEGTRSPPACRSLAQIPYPRGPKPCLGKGLLSASAMWRGSRIHWSCVV